MAPSDSVAVPGPAASIVILLGLVAGRSAGAAATLSVFKGVDCTGTRLFDYEYGLASTQPTQLEGWPSDAVEARQVSYNATTREVVGNATGDMSIECAGSKSVLIRWCTAGAAAGHPDNDKAAAAPPPCTQHPLAGAAIRALGGLTDGRCVPSRGGAPGREVRSIRLVGALPPALSGVPLCGGGLRNGIGEEPSPVMWRALQAGGSGGSSGAGGVGGNSHSQGGSENQGGPVNGSSDSEEDTYQGPGTAFGAALLIIVLSIFFLLICTFVMLNRLQRFQ